MTPHALAASLAAAYSERPEVVAVALGGSSATVADSSSDLDLYVYVLETVPLSVRERIARKSSTRAEVGNAFWEPGDEWIDRESGVAIDVMFRETRWIERHLRELLEHHRPSIGYTTAIWHNVRNSIAVFERDSWFTGLQHYAARDYPRELRDAIVAHNLPLLRANLSSYTAQIEKAAARGDVVSLNHRATAFLASWFDVLFAINLATHPGEKRLLDHAEHLRIRPANMREHVTALIGAVPTAHDCARIASALADELEHLVRN